MSGTLSNNENVCPSIGDVDLLVIPVHLLGGDAYKTDQVKNDIRKAFFSKTDKRSGYCSLTNYYYESSYHKLNFGGTVTDWFDVTEHTSIDSVDDITSGSSGTIISKILRKAVAWANQGIDLTKFDKNSDGAIDGIWLVYDHLDWSTEFNQRYKADPTYTGSDLNDASGTSLIGIGVLKTAQKEKTLLLQLSLGLLLICFIPLMPVMTIMA